MAQRNPVRMSLSDQLLEERRKVDFDSYDITVQQLNAMIGKRQIDVAPAYQRRFRWDASRQSQLIESILLGIPVPSLFMATNADGTWEVVDGVQRLSSIAHFSGDNDVRNVLNIDEPLTVEGLEKLSSMNEKKFESLPDSIKIQFLLRPVKVTTLSDKSDLKVRFDLFQRLNTGGVSLTNQEIRGVIYRGEFNDFLEELASNKDFKSIVKLRQSNEMDGTREEFVLRFFAFLYNYKKFEHSVIDFLNTYMESATKRFDYNSAKNIFSKTFKQLSNIIPDGIRRRTKVTPVNLYEAIAVGAGIAIQKNGKLKKSKIDTWIDSEELRKLTTGATNAQKMVRGRIEFAAEKFGVL